MGSWFVDLCSFIETGIANKKFIELAGPAANGVVFPENTPLPSNDHAGLKLDGFVMIGIGNGRWVEDNH